MRFFFLNLLLIVSLAHFKGAAQSNQQKIDSLQNVAGSNVADSNTVKAMFALADIFKYSDKDKALQYAESSKRLSQKINYPKGYNLAMLVTGSIYFIQGNYDTAEVYYNSSLAYFRKQGLKKETAKCLSNLGNLNNYKGNPGKALPLLLESAKISYEINDLAGLANANTNIGNVYYQQAKYNEALPYYFNALAQSEKLSKKSMQAQLLNNIGAVMRLKNKVDSAIFYYRRSMALREGDGNIEAQAESNLNIGDAYFSSSLADSAFYYFKRAQSLYKELGHQKGLTVCYIDLGSYYTLKKENKKAVQYFLMADSLSQKIKAMDFRAEAAKDLTELYRQEGDYKSAFTYQALMMQLKDSMLNEHNQKQLNELKAIYESEKKDKDLLKKEAEIEKQLADNKQKATERNAFVAGFAFMLVLAFFIFRGYRHKRKANLLITAQKEEVEQQRNKIQLQKELIEEKQKEVLDSIHYAKRIQTALLPSDRYIERNLNKLKRN